MTKKFLIIITMLIVMGLIAVDFLGQADYLLVAAASPLYLVARLAILGLLGALLIWTPPRSAWLRFSLGLGGLIAMVGAGWLIASSAVNFLDIMLFALVAIIFTIEALELQPVNLTNTTRALSS